MKTNTKAKAIAIIMAILVIATFVSVSASADRDTPVIITNMGSIKKPVFAVNDGSQAFCLERNKTAPNKQAAGGTEYVPVETIIYNDELKNIVVNYNVNTYEELDSDARQVVCQYAIWATLENAVEECRGLAVLMYGDNAGTYFDSLFNNVDGYTVEATEYDAGETNQRMLVVDIQEIVPETTTEAPTEPTPEPIPEPTTVVETTTEPVPEPTTKIPETTTVVTTTEPTPEPTTKAPETTTVATTTEPIPEPTTVIETTTELTTEAPVETTTEKVTFVFEEYNDFEATPEEPVVKVVNNVSIPKTGAHSPAAILAIAIIAIACSAVVVFKKKNYHD